MVGRHVHDPGSAVDEVGDERRRLGVRVADGRQVPGVHRLDVGELQPPLHTVLRRHLDQPPAGVAASRDHPELERGVAVEQGGQLGAREPRGAEHVDPGHVRSRPPAASSAS